MGRPRIVRTPEEQRAYEEQRREQKRECQRRRRAAFTDEDRAREAERKRRAMRDDQRRDAHNAAQRRSYWSRRQRHHAFPYPVDIDGETPPVPVPCLHHSHGQLADHLARVSRMMLPCTCGKDLNGTSSPQHTDSETTAPVIKTEPEGAPSDEEFFEMPLTVEMRIGKEPSNPAVAVKEEPLDIPITPMEDAGEANEILGVTGIETLVLAAKCQAEQAAENESREPEDVARSTCLT
ncbi:uncharacterized protein LOC144145602 isoform X2 [Haemaphysalis longicornis]